MPKIETCVGGGDDPGANTKEGVLSHLVCRPTLRVISNGIGHISSAVSNLKWYLSRAPGPSNESISMSISDVLCQK